MQQENNILSQASGDFAAAKAVEDQALLLYRLCQMQKALPQFLKAMTGYKEAEAWSDYCRNLALVIRICVEGENQPLLDQLWNEFMLLRQQPNFSHTSRVHYAMAIYYNYTGDPVRSHEHFKSALNLALSSDGLLDEAYARIGLAAYYYTAGQDDMALYEIEKAKQIALTQAGTPKDIALSALVFESIIRRRTGDLGRAVEVLEEAKSRAHKEINLYMFINILYNLGLTLVDVGQASAALTHIQTAQSLAPEDLVRFRRALQSALTKVQGTREVKEDIYLEDGLHPRIRIKGRSPIALKNQHLLAELLKMLGSEPRRAWSKEEIVEALWKESYHPFKHDNKLYVTIRRLRCLIEKNEKRPEIIIKNQKGYMMNPALTFAFGQAT